MTQTAALQAPAERRLVVLPVSPWSERARWVLDHHGLEYRAIEHVPFLGERRLRRLVPPLIRRLLLPLTRYGTRWFARKYALDLENTRAPLQALRETLDALRRALDSSGYVLGQFGYADIVMATLLQGVVPVSDAYLPIGAATRQAFTQTDLGAAYGDLIAWRDGIYARHRKEVPE